MIFRKKNKHIFPPPRRLAGFAPTRFAVLRPRFAKLLREHDLSPRKMIAKQNSGLRLGRVTAVVSFKLTRVGTISKVSRASSIRQGRRSMNDRGPEREAR